MRSSTLRDLFDDQASLRVEANVFGTSCCLLIVFRSVVHRVSKKMFDQAEKKVAKIDSDPILIEKSRVILQKRIKFAIVLLSDSHSFVESIRVAREKRCGFCRRVRFSHSGLVKIFFHDVLYANWKHATCYITINNFVKKICCSITK